MPAATFKAIPTPKPPSACTRPTCLCSCLAPSQLLLRCAPQSEENPIPYTRAPYHNHAPQHPPHAAPQPAQGATLPTHHPTHQHHAHRATSLSIPTPNVRPRPQQLRLRLRVRPAPTTALAARLTAPALIRQHRAGARGRGRGAAALQPVREQWASGAEERAGQQKELG